MKLADYGRFVFVSVALHLTSLLLSVEPNAALTAVFAWGYTIVCAINRQRPS